MKSYVCGRCGQRTAPNSTYCPRDHWTIFVEPRVDASRAGAAVAALEMPRGLGGLFERRRLEKQRAHIEHELQKLLDKRIEEWEKRLEAEPHNPEIHKHLGIYTLLNRHFERANAHLQQAHQLNAFDYETHVNLAYVQVRRGQYGPALELLQSARNLWPDNPLVIFDLMLVALQMRRAELVLEMARTLAALWQNNPAIENEYRDDTLAARGLALLQLGKNTEALATLQAAAGFRPQPLGAGQSSEQNSEEAEEDPESFNAAERHRLIHAVEEYNRREEEQRKAEAGEIVAAPVAVAAPEATDKIAEKLEGGAAGADALSNLAVAEATLGHYEQAIARLGVALRMEPGNTVVHNNLGVLAFEQGHLNASLRHLEIARQIEEFAEQREAATHNHLGVVLAAAGRLDESWEEFHKAGSHERAEFEVFYNLGRAYIEAGKMDRGVSYLRRAFQANPNHPDVHAVMGTAYLLRGQANMLAEAVKHFKRALQLNNRHREAYFDLAITLHESGNHAGAVAVVAQGLKAYPQAAELLFLRARLTLDEEKDNPIPRAGTAFSEVLKVQPEMLASQYDMALCQFVMGFRDVAAQQLEGVTNRDPSFAPAFFLIGVGHAVANRYSEALAAWQKAAQFEPNNPELQANMGFLYYQYGDWQNAIKSYTNAHRMLPNDADLLACLGLCYGRAGAAIQSVWDDLQAKKPNQTIVHPPHEVRMHADFLNRSIGCFQQSLQITPHSPITHSNLGLAFYFQKQVEKAVDQWRLVSQLDARYAQSREEDQYREFDDSQIALRPFNWRTRIVDLAPVLPHPHTRLLPGRNLRRLRPALADPELQRAYKQRVELEHILHLLGWLHVKNEK